MATRYLDVDDYIASLAPGARDAMIAAREAVHAAVPGAGETISYQMPTFTLDGRRFMHLAAWKQHIALYPIPAGMDDELAPYAGDKGTLRFPLREPIPYELIGRTAAALARQLA